MALRPSGAVMEYAFGGVEVEPVMFFRAVFVTDQDIGPDRSVRLDKIDRDDAPGPAHDAIGKRPQAAVGKTGQAVARLPDGRGPEAHAGQEGAFRLDRDLVPIAGDFEPLRRDAGRESETVDHLGR